ncbi:MAG: electron transfer flavoprotein alpha subunit [Nocardioidaceae bacterium]|nr:electron transfer flavoprotein alpha subunit [Nocardioidaceae bacterium]
MTLVLVETDATGATETSLETLTFARGVAARSDSAALEAIMVGPLSPDVSDHVLDQMREQGVAVVHHAEGGQLSAYAAAAWAAAVVETATSSSTRVVMAAGTPRGSEVMAHVATRLQVPMAANVVAADETQPLVVSRQVMGGSVLEEMRLDGDLAVLTVAGHSTSARPAEEPTEPKLVTFEPALTDADLVARVVSIEESEKADTAGLTNARVVVGGGRGAGSAEGFADLLELADLLGGALGVSRVVTSLGWRPHHEQVGQTGSRIAPDLYVACGISGAIQHWAGCQSAKTILAINTDPDAPMVTKAHYAVIGDLHEIVPAINEELRRRQAHPA